MIRKLIYSWWSSLLLWNLLLRRQSFFLRWLLRWLDLFFLNLTIVWHSFFLIVSRRCLIFGRMIFSKNLYFFLEDISSKPCFFETLKNGILKLYWTRLNLFLFLFLLSLYWFLCILWFGVRIFLRISWLLFGLTFSCCCYYLFNFLILALQVFVKLFQAFIQLLITIIVLIEVAYHHLYQFVIFSCMLWSWRIT